MEILKIGSVGEDVRALQKALASELGLAISADGQFGPGTARILGQWQTTQGIVEKDSQGIPMYGPISKNISEEYIENNFITEHTYNQAAEQLGVEARALKAFALTESKGQGFLPNGFPVILFERHKFYQAVSLKYSSAEAIALANKMPSICNPNAGGYLGYEREIPRLEQAASFDWQCAHSSASWGQFQVMGFNHKRCGFSTLEEFVEAHKASEQMQMYGFVNFLASDPNIVRALKAKNWKVCAALYNGTGNIAVYSKKMLENYISIQ